MLWSPGKGRPDPSLSEAASEIWMLDIERNDHTNATIPSKVLLVKLRVQGLDARGYVPSTAACLNIVFANKACSRCDNRSMHLADIASGCCILAIPLQSWAMRRLLGDGTRSWFRALNMHC